MSLFQVISDFFESLFNKNSPEVQKKIQMRKLENELRAQEPLIFKNGKLLPNFAETIRLLYINTKPLNDLMSSTIYSTDIPRNLRFENQLVLTGFSEPSQKIVASLEYEKRKAQLTTESAMTTSQIFDRQHKNLERILRELNSDTFKKIDYDLNMLKQLNDFCKFNFVTVLQIFDPNFISADPHYHPSYMEIPVEKIVNILEDLYYVEKGLTITTSTLNAISALVALTNGSSVHRNPESLKENLKKIAFIINHIITADRLRLLICFAKGDVEYMPQAATYKDSAKKHFSEMLQAKFKSDEQRIKTEIKDERINNELTNLFGNVNLLSLNGYNNETNAKLLANSSSTFSWIMPMRILKTFLATYLSDSIRSLLNDIVVEGFFNNPQFKTDFSSETFAALECSQDVQAFETSFTSGQENSIATIEGFIHDSHNDPEFFKKLDQMINRINLDASKIITKDINSLHKLSTHLETLLQDAKKPTSEIISNLKVLIMSSRNRDNTDLLEQQFPKWKIFFDIMKNYAIITN